MEQPQIFSLWKNIVKKEKVKIAIDGSSYDLNDECLETLSSLNIYEQFDVLYISKEEIKEKKLNFRFFTPEYKRKNEIVLKRIDSEDLWGSGFKDEEIKNILSIELIGSILYGDIVVTKTEVYPILKNHYLEDVFNGKRPFIGRLSEGLSAIRPWINNHKKLTTDSGSSYWFSQWISVNFAKQRLQPHFKPAWRAAVVTVEDNFLLGEGTVQSFLSSISLRCMHLITTRDLLEVLRLNSFDALFNPKADNYFYKVIYYVGYFFLLITAIIDSSEWITSWRILNQEKDKTRFSFRNKKSFLKDLVRFNNDLSNYVFSDSIQSTLKLIYGIRNFIAHGEMPKNISYSGFGGLSGNLICLNRKIENKINEFASKNNFDSRHLLEIGIEIKRPTRDRKDDEIVIEPILFLRYTLKKVMEFVDTVFKYLSIEKKMITTQREKDKYNQLGKTSTKKNDEFYEKTKEVLIAIEASVP